MLNKVFVILDASGSMMGVKQSTIDGLNEFLQKLKADKNEYKFTMVTFNDGVDRLYTDEDISQIPAFTADKYKPDGMTALYDAIGMTLNDCRGDVATDEKAIVLILTDGAENASVEYKREDISKLISELEDKDNWTFTFMGANQDSWAAAQSIGLKNVGNVVNYSGDQMGTRSAFTTMSAATMDLGGSSSLKSKAFYAGKSPLGGSPLGKTPKKK